MRTTSSARPADNGSQRPPLATFSRGTGVTLGSEDDVLEAVELQTPTRGHADSLGDALRPKVLGTNQRDDARITPTVEGGIARGGRRFRRISVAPERPVQQPPDFGLAHAFHLLKRKTNLSEGHSTGPFDDEPEPVTVAAVAIQLTLQPLFRVLPTEPFFVVPAHVRIVQHRGDEIEILEPQLAEREPRRLEDGSLNGRHRPTSGAPAATPEHTKSISRP